LYYADIYKYENDSPVFDDWDSNGNGIFAEWSRDSAQKDILDLRPDVYVGRLACRNIIEVANVVKKIIIYETQTHGKAWFNHMILAAGDTFPNPYNEFEGEMEANRSASYMASLGVDVTRLFASDGTLTLRKDVIRAMNQGSGFMHFAGHGNPSIWSTHPSNDIDTWIDGLSIADMGKLRNRNKLPICIIGGCHTHKFDVTILDVLHGIKEDGLHYFSADEDDFGSFWLFEWVPECLGWRMISKRNVGAIATIGNTGLGYGYPGNSTLQGLGGWIEPRFFHAIGVQRKTTLGEAHSQAIIDYANTFDVHGDRIDCKTVQQWILLGDPSLKLGGYSS
ncbi:peptidase C25, partial [bacterium]|nr:peptidase C25 [bacterium]